MTSCVEDGGVGVLDERRRDSVADGDRIPQQLEHQRWVRRRRGPAGPSPRTGCRPPSRPATAMRVGSPPSSPACSPTHCSAAQASSTPGGEGMFGGEPVVDRHHDRLGADRVRAGHVVVGVEVADRPAATVVVDDHGQVVVLRRPAASRCAPGCRSSSPYPTVRSSIRMCGNISGGGFTARNFSRATSTPSSMVNSSGTASSSALRMRVDVAGRRADEVSRHAPQASARTQCGQAPAFDRSVARRHHPGVAQIAVHQRLGVVHLRRHPGGGQQFAVADAVVAQRVVSGHRDVGRRQPGEVDSARAGTSVAGGFAQVDPGGVQREKLADRVAAEDRRVGVLGERRQRGVPGGRRVPQQLEGDRRSARRRGPAAPPPRPGCRRPNRPATASRLGSAPSSSACAATHRVAAQTSSTAAG